MAKNTTINLRVDSEVKEQAGEILSSRSNTSRSCCVGIRQIPRRLVAEKFIKVVLK